MKKYCKLLCLAISAAVIFFALVPLAIYGVLRTGVVVLLIFGGLLAALTLLWDAFIGYGRVCRGLREVSDHRPLYVPRWWRRLRTMFALALALAVVMGCAVSVPMARQAYYNTPPAGQSTVVILGCQVIGEEPSLMLLRRINAAVAYLDVNPDATVICAGGQGDIEAVSEASVMRRVLLERGIAADRIFIDEQSSDTAENLQNSAELIADNQLSTQVAIATDGFHQLRASIYAERSGLSATSLPAKTPWGLLPSYWVREWFALAEAVFLA